MEFCPKCNTHMERRIEQNDIIVCPKCGFKEEGYKKINDTDIAATINSPQPPMQSERTTLEVTDLSDANPTPLPTIDIDCLKCGWLRQDLPVSRALNFTDAQSAIIHGEIMSSKRANC